MYIDYETLKRKPWVGIFIGLVGSIMFGYFSYVSVEEYIKYSKQMKPEEVTVDDLQLEEGQRKWIKITNGHTICDSKVEMVRRIPERWISGRVESTYFVMTNVEKSKAVILKFNDEVDCQAINKDITGVLSGEGDNYYGSHLPDVLKQYTNITQTYVLNVNAGLNNSTDNIYFCCFMLLLCIGLIFFSIYLHSENKKDLKVFGQV